MKSFSAGFLGSFLAVILIIGLAAGIGSFVASKKSKIEDRSQLVIELYGELPEYDPPGGVLSAVTGGDVETLTRVLDNLRMAAIGSTA